MSEKGRPRPGDVVLVRGTVAHGVPGRDEVVVAFSNGKAEAVPVGDVVQVEGKRGG